MTIAVDLGRKAPNQTKSKPKSSLLLACTIAVNWDVKHQTIFTIFIVAKRADSDEMPHFEVFHMGLNCLPKYPFRGFQNTKW